jgi:hypothetical protein
MDRQTAKLPECTLGMAENDLCQANQVLPNGDANYEINNCYTWDVFRFTSRNHSIIQIM